MEVLLATSAHDGYSDGDIVEAFSLNRIRLAHAQTLTSVQRFPLDAVSGLRVPDTALIKFLRRRTNIGLRLTIIPSLRLIL